MRVIIASLIAVAIAVAGFSIGPALAGSPDRDCFPASKWGPAVDPGLRPCVEVTRLYEDGSFRYRVTDANGTFRYAGGVGAADR